MDNADSRGRLVSIVDIAEATGASRSAVSRALNDQPGVNPALRQRIKDAAQQLGYFKDFRATALKTQHTGTIGLLVRLQQLAPYAAFITAVQHAAERQGYRLAVVTQSSDEDDQAWSFLMGLRPEGVIVASSRIRDERVQSAARRLPVVLAAPEAPDGVGAVGFGTAAVAPLVRAVTQAGHSHAALLVCPESRTLAARSAALSEELQRRGVTVVDVPVIDDAPDAAALHEALGLATVVVAPSDELALAAWQQAADAGHTVSATGFGGFIGARLLGLTTVGFPVEEAAEAAVTQVIERLREPHLPARRVLLEGEVLAGRSLATPKPSTRRRIGAW